MLRFIETIGCWLQVRRDPLAVIQRQWSEFAEGLLTAADLAKVPQKEVLSIMDRFLEDLMSLYQQHGWRQKDPRPQDLTGRWRKPE